MPVPADLEPTGASDTSNGPSMIGRALVAPISPKTWLATVQVVLDFFVGAAVFTVITVALSITMSLICTIVLVPVALWVTLVLARGVGFIERARLDAILDVRVVDPYPVFQGSLWDRFWARLACPHAWKELAYALILFPLAIVGFSVVITAWAGSLALLGLPLYVEALPGKMAHFGLFTVYADGPGRWAVGLAGLLGLLVAPWISRAWASLDAFIGRSLLGRSATAELEDRVDTLEVTRAWAVEVAEAERRRIERDLHDGAQQRLVALAMDLGMAKEKFDADPEGARTLIDDAHREAKRALTELRDLARGIHPVTLGDRGLPGAIPALASRCAIPVEVQVHVPERPTPSIEGMAYFIVSECLANASKHSRASHIAVHIAAQERRLSIMISDDGMGGAEARNGSGLRGLAERVASVDGRFDVTSPVGGPTVIRAELPCVS